MESTTKAKVLIIATHLRPNVLWNWNGELFFAKMGLLWWTHKTEYGDDRISEGSTRSLRTRW